MARRVPGNPHWLRAQLSLAVLGAAGCFEAHDEPQGAVTPQSACAEKCHGDRLTPAPPLDLRGHTAESEPGVGAHRRHLSPHIPFASVPCQTCHLVPRSTADPGHADTAGPAEVVLSGVAVYERSDARYDVVERQCTAYCHQGPADTAAPWPAQAAWTRPLPGDQSCGSACHALPPGGNHPRSNACESCHPATAGPNQTVIHADYHGNGVVEVETQLCSTCHGDDGSPAPPPDSHGNTQTTAPSVGAHRRHVDPSLMRYAMPIACDTCHAVPPSSNVHRNGTADVALQGLSAGTQPSSSSRHQTVPVWSGGPSFTCSGVYCHGDWAAGESSSGAAVPRPVWVQVDGTQGRCGSCHTLPPPPPHPARSECSSCHGTVVDETNQIVDRSRHVNGQLDR